MTLEDLSPDIRRWAAEQAAAAPPLRPDTARMLAKMFGLPVPNNTPKPRRQPKTPPRPIDEYTPAPKSQQDRSKQRASPQHSRRFQQRPITVAGLLQHGRHHPSEQTTAEDHAAALQPKI